MLVLAAVAVWSYVVGTSRWGLKPLATHDEVAAQAMGIKTTWVKVAPSPERGSRGWPAIYARHVGYIDPITAWHY